MIDNRAPGSRVTDSVPVRAGALGDEGPRACLPVHPPYATKGRTVARGRRYAGDFPLRPSGYLRSSCRRFREADGGYIIGPTAP